MLAGGRFGGHIVSGHIDGVGTISSIKEDDNAVWYTVEAPSNILRYIIEKGSITLDGISLTVAKVTNSNFSVSIIPHTRAQTNLASKKVGDVLNLENDLVGKYVERLMLQPIAASQEQPEQKSSGITKEFLSHYGF